MEPADAVKSTLQTYLQNNRGALLWKLDGLSERELRTPRTPTGMNLLGIVKHMAHVELGYFGDTFGRQWPTPDERVAEVTFEVDPQADWYATPEESADGLIDFYRRVQVFADGVIAELPLDAPGSVPWWPAERRSVTLGTVLVRVLVDLARHAGHADILRELLDGSVGMQADITNVPDADWTGYVAKLTTIAEQF